nr:hypothetical protein [Tanacetum cinerariifolium]
MIDGSGLTNYGFATHGFVGTAFDDDHSKKKLAYRFIWDGIPLTVQPPWPNSRGKAINESAASCTKVICLAIKFLKMNSASRSLDDEEEPKWMDREWVKLHARGRLSILIMVADMHHRKAEMEEDVEITSSRTDPVGPRAFACSLSCCVPYDRTIRVGNVIRRLAHSW